MKVKTYSFWISLAAYCIVTASNDFSERHCYSCNYGNNTCHDCIDKPCDTSTVLCDDPAQVCFTHVIQHIDFENEQMIIHSMTRGCVAEDHFVEGCTSGGNTTTWNILCTQNLCNGQDESSKDGAPIEDCPTTPTPSTTTSGGNGGNSDSTTTANDNGGNGEGTTTANDNGGNGGSDDKTTTPNNNNGGNDNGGVYVIVLVPLNILFAFLTVY